MSTLAKAMPNCLLQSPPWLKMAAEFVLILADGPVSWSAKRDRGVGGVLGGHYTLYDGH